MRVARVGFLDWLSRDRIAERSPEPIFRKICVSIVLTALALFASSGRAAEPEDVGSGALLMRARGGGLVVEAVRLGTDIDMTVSGLTVRTRVTQAFRNTSDQWVEAVYVYPLPEEGGVDTLRMVVGDKVILGEIKKKAEAQAIYDTARSQGVKASLIEQQRPNLFTNSVANVGPGETVLVQFEYQVPVSVSDGAYSLRAPLVVAPRYTPRGTPPTPDAMAPIIDPRVQGKINPVTITVRLKAGFPLATVQSPSHAVKVQDERGGKRVTLAEGEVPADRDFILTWRASPTKAPAVGLFHEEVAGADYILAQVVPPIAARTRPPVARDIVFVIDNSGSMGGESIRQARASLAYGLAQLRPGDRFNLVRFDDSLTVLFPDVVAATPEMVARAQRFVAGLEARGGTEMVPAMAAALADDRSGDAERVRQVVFLTDGAIGNEQGLFDVITSRRGRSRIFMVGIGSAPNDFLMSRAAELGRGTFTHIGSSEAVEEAMRELFDKLESPVATNLSAAIRGAEADLAPGELPDLYLGEPITVAARVGSMKGALTIRGMIAGKAWESEIPLARAEAGKGISKVWARRKITDFEVARSLGRIDGITADAGVLRLGLDHQLVTSQTSLVAVDKTPSRPPGARLTRADLPLNLPAGWDFDALFGRSRLQNDSGGTDPHADQQVASLDLPSTATEGPLLVLTGLSLLALAGVLGGAGLFLTQRRQAA